MQKYIILDADKIKELDDICYKKFVTEDGINFKFPFTKGTTRYIAGIGKDSDVIPISPDIESLVKTDMKTVELTEKEKKDFNELVISGKIIAEFD